MLPNEATTRSDLCPPPEQLEALVVAPSREAARPLVAFLRRERLNVTVVQDAETAFEEALLHRPNVVVIDEALPPAGGLDLCERLKANSRTHFLPAILFARPPEAKSERNGRPQPQPDDGWGNNPQQRLLALRAGADALLSSATDEEESSARLWALLRSEALHRRQERKQKVQGTVLKERGRWLETFVHDLQNAVGALQANFEFLGQTALARSAEQSEDVSDCVRETRALLQQLTRGLRTVQDFERFESGMVRPRQTPIDLAELLAEVKEDVRWQISLGAEAPPGAGLPGDTTAPSGRMQVDGTGPGITIVADRDLLRQALGALAAYLLRQPRTTQLQVQVTPTRGGTNIELQSDGPALSEEEGERLFEPYARISRRTALAQGIALAHARAIVELHGGTVKATAGGGGGAAAFLVELKSRDPSPNHTLGR